jgi:hypothetical protein
MEFLRRIGDATRRFAAQLRRNRGIALLALTIAVLNGLMPGVESLARSADKNAGFIEICTSTGLKVVALSEVRTEGSDTATAEVDGASDPASQRRSPGNKMSTCVLCLLGADTDSYELGLLSVRTELALPGHVAYSHEWSDAFVLQPFMAPTHARGPPAQAGHSITQPESLIQANFYQMQGRTSGLHVQGAHGAPRTEQALRAQRPASMLAARDDTLSESPPGGLAHMCAASAACALRGAAQEPEVIFISAISGRVPVVVHYEWLDRLEVRRAVDSLRS